MARHKRPEPYATLRVEIPQALFDRLMLHITPPGASGPPQGRRQALLIRLIRDWCDEQDTIKAKGYHILNL